MIRSRLTLCLAPSPSSPERSPVCSWRWRTPSSSSWSTPPLCSRPRSTRPSPSSPSGPVTRTPARPLPLPPPRLPPRSFGQVERGLEVRVGRGTVDWIRTRHRIQVSRSRPRLVFFSLFVMDEGFCTFCWDMHHGQGWSVFSFYCGAGCLPVHPFSSDRFQFSSVQFFGVHRHSIVFAIPRDVETNDEAALRRKISSHALIKVRPTRMSSRTEIH
jgi:hypothetical protein